MNTTDTLRALIADNAILPISQEHGKNICILSEPESNYEFKLRHLPMDSLIIKCDKFPNTDVFFRSDNMECKRADYALVSESEKIIMFFELKRSTTSAKNVAIVAQLKGAACILEYCGLIAGSFLGVRDIFYKFDRRYYIVHRKSSVRRSFEEEKKLDNRTPENARKLGGPFTSFEYLL